MEIFLYGCGVCDNVICLYSDYGRVHLHMCTSCNGGTFHEKIIIGTKYSKDIPNLFEGYVFMLEEKKDGGTEKE